jgi:hypothetical protein
MIQALLTDGAGSGAMPEPWQSLGSRLHHPAQLTWARVDRDRGQWTLHSAPMELATIVGDRSRQQPLVLMGGALDVDSDAVAYRQRLGLVDMTCLKFAPDRHSEAIQLYIPDRLPLPNTPQFQNALLGELAQLILQPQAQQGIKVVLVGDTPLKAQVGAMLAAQFGSRGAGGIHHPAREWCAGYGLGVLATPSRATARPRPPSDRHPTHPFFGRSPRGGSRCLLQTPTARLVSPLSAAHGVERIAAGDRPGARSAGPRRSAR